MKTALLRLHGYEGNRYEIEKVFKNKELCIEYIKIHPEINFMEKLPDNIVVPNIKICEDDNIDSSYEVIDKIEEIDEKRQAILDAFNNRKYEHKFAIEV